MIRRVLLIAGFILLQIELFAQVSPKRGLAYGYNSQADLTTLSEGISWWYNWSQFPDAGVKDYYSSIGVEFVPMIWGGTFDVNTVIANMPAGAKYLLAFNEPNMNVESNLTPEQAAALWPKIEQIAAAKNLEIISASAIYCGGSSCSITNPITWHDAFFAACPTCKVDYIAFHSYEPTAGGVKGLTDNLKKYGRPIWVTEFANWDSNQLPADKIAYLQELVDDFENDPDIYRYSWFTGRSSSNSSINILGTTDGSLTALGTAYINAVYGPKNSIPGKIEAETHYRRKGTALENTSDTGLGQDVGYIDVGDWAEYLVDISNTASYTFEFRLASNAGGGKFDITLDGAMVQSNVVAPTTGGWQTWTTIQVSGVVLTQGEHLLRFNFTGGGFNINYFNTILESAVPANADFSATPLATCAGSQITFTDKTTTKSGGETYVWNFGSGASPSTATGAGPHTISYSMGGQKTVSLTVTNANGSNTKTKSNYITIADQSTTCIFSDDYNDNTVKWITPIPGAFSHSEYGTDWTIANNGYGEWETFDYTLNNGTYTSPIDFSCSAIKPVLKIRAKASANCLLRVTLVDANGVTIDNVSNNFELTTSYQTFSFDFSKHFKNYYSATPGNVDSTDITDLQFAINPGFYSYPYHGTNGTYNTAFTGTVDIDWIGIGNNCNVITGLANAVSEKIFSFSAFPNPFKENVTLNINSSKVSNYSFKVIDASGGTIFSKDNCSKDEELSFDKSLPAGIYMVVIYSADTVETHKIIKSN